MSERLTAIVPMRTQPLHLGHINLVLNLSRSFTCVRVIVGNQPRSKEDPFSPEVRFRWWHQAKLIYKLDLLELRMGAHGLSDLDRVARYFGNTEGEAVLVSGNQEVCTYWAARNFAVQDVNTIYLQPLLDGLPAALISRRDQNSRQIRLGLHDEARRGELMLLLPEFMREEATRELIRVSR